jgi:4-hydroxy-3-methylbut-2-en-1-yl diphosphate reductase
MIVEIDENSGFCWGVVRAIEFAEKELQKPQKLFSLGDIIHNPVEIERLGKLGLKTISHESLYDLKDSKILIRAHGEPPATYKIAGENNIEIIDATCPIVKKVQERIKFFYNNGYQIIIFGKVEHAEVIGLNGVCNNSAIVIKTKEESLNIPLKEKNVIFSQTTMDPHHFEEIINVIKTKAIEENKNIEILVKDTICRSVADREGSLKEFAEKFDIIIFVSGRNSSNGQFLFKICKNYNNNTFFVEKSSEIQKEWLKDAGSVGITGATSTPNWAMEEVKKYILNLFNSHTNKINY